MSMLSKVIDQDDMHKITSEFSRLRDRCYLEHAGSALYPQRLLESINDDLMNNVYTNPHTDKYTRDCVDQIRSLVLNHFNTDPSTYSVVFTSGTTQSLKLLVESFQFGIDDNEVLNCGSFVYTRDNHTSVLGLREIAVEKNADVIHINHDEFLNSLEGTETPSKWKERYKNEGNTLLVYPAQNNFNGFKYPINCMDKIKDGCLNSYIKKQLCKVNCNWYILLDAASYVATSKLDLSIIQPDFVGLSFYKIFGFPTGLGALLIKNSSSNVLNQKRYFGGGTVDIVLSSEDFHVKRESLHERFEDGTVPFLSVIALKHCFDVFNSLIPKMIRNDVMDTISYHTFYLAKDLYQQLKNLHHKNGRPAAVLYMDSDFTDINKQGATVTFNIKREDGSYIGYAEFQHLAELFSISLRTGCFCNSGSCQRHLNATNKEMKDMYKAGHKCGDEIDLVQGKPTGAVRASFGYHNTFEDVDKLMDMIHQCFLKTKFKIPKRLKTSFEIMKPPESEKIINGDKSKLVDDEYFRDIETPFIKNDISLQEIAIFPVKSCGAFKIKSGWSIGTKGFKYDREWMIVKENGTCLTQKRNTRMCMIKPTIDLKQKLLILNFKGQSSISLPLNPSSSKLKEKFKFCQSKVCTDIVQGYDCGDEVAEWISKALEVPFLRLIRQSHNDKRKVKNKSDKVDMLALSNQAQFLLINKATVRWLNDKIDDPEFNNNVDQLTDRFRANIVVDMDEELVEREWQRVVIGKHEFKVEGQCSRCQMVCIDQATGLKTVEPLRTISQQFAGKMRFGIYLTYVGTIDGSRDNVLKINSHVKPCSNEDDISRFQDWFYLNFLSNSCYPRDVYFTPYKQRRKFSCR